jgi:hypothetical protein
MTPSTDDPSKRDPLAKFLSPSSGSGRSLGELISPDDWRLYHIMRELGQLDRALIIEFAELLFDLRHAQDDAKRRAG